jgi:thiamine biosynthesis lipoprotein
MIIKSLNNKKGSLICLFFVFVFAGCNPTENENQKINKLAGEALGTTYHITYLGEEIPGIQGQIDSLITQFNSSLSTYDPTSLISKFNTNQKFESPKDSNDKRMFYFRHMVELSKEITEKTNGAFDPTAASLFGIYSRAKKQGVLMNSTAVLEALSHQGFDKFEFTDTYAFKRDSAAQLNFNAIAKGYFVDLLYQLFIRQRELGVMVEVGGEVSVSAKNAKGQAWKIGINTPVENTPANTYFDVRELSNESMATSGNYQNFYRIDGKLIGHTINPKTGKPVISDLKSASVIHTSCAVADAYATACMVMGLEKSKELIENDRSLSAYFIYEEDGKLKGIFVE